MLATNIANKSWISHTTKQFSTMSWCLTIAFSYEIIYLEEELYPKGEETHHKITPQLDASIKHRLLTVLLS